MSGLTRMKSRIFRIRLFRWEYWSFHTVYLPVYPIWLLLCLRARSLFFFAASNPRIKNGGFLGESKKEIHELVSATLQPRTIFFEKGTDHQRVMDQLQIRQFRFPLIGKPDVGGRGRGVKKLDDLEAVATYASLASVDFLIQEFIPYENEIGIFYYRFPNRQQGKISGMVGKQFLKVTGDGKQSVRELLLLNPRALLQLPDLEQYQPELLDCVIPAAEVFTVVPYGNHARGAKFLDETDELTAGLRRRLNAICGQIPECYFGRLDIRYRSLELLEAGKDFSIIEVNGAGSEPTHMYDPRHSLFFAWKEIVRHWIILFKISRANHRRGYPYLSFSEGLRMFREDRQHSKQLDLMKKLQ
ncbi:MAG: hypothetical protein ACHQDF_02100 [Chitinophagales bacterium]